MQTHLHLSLHTHPIHLRGLATGVAAELIPTIFQHPADFALSPHRKPAGISSGDHSPDVGPGWSRHHTICADHRKEGDHAVFRQLLALLEHPGIDDAIAGGIEQFNACLHRITGADGVGAEFDHVAVVDDQDVVGRNAHRLSSFAVGNEHAVLTMHRHKIFGLGEGQHQLLVFLEAVARDVNTLALAINHLGTEHHQPVDRVDHRDGVARDRAGRENNRVGAFNLHLGMLATGDAA